MRGFSVTRRELYLLELLRLDRNATFVQKATSLSISEFLILSQKVMLREVFPGREIIAYEASVLFRFDL